jgi:hypothetical protein
MLVVTQSSVYKNGCYCRKAAFGGKLLMVNFWQISLV